MSQNNRGSGAAARVEYLRTSEGTRVIGGEEKQESSVTDKGIRPGLDMQYLVRALVKYNASDLHLKAGRPPLFRINGRLLPAKMEELSMQQVEAIVYGVMKGRQRVEFEEKKQVDLSFVVPDLGRFRCNAFFQRNTVSAAVRLIPFAIPRLDTLGLPAALKEVSQRPRGLILVTGSSGSGKSTTMAAMIQHMNETCSYHILTLEDPIEFVHRDMKATISQREVGTDCHTLREGLYAGMRQDPDVIVIGELRDYQMIQMALSAAESGHLVMATLHTNDARSTVDRVLEVFPPEGQNQARIQLSATLIAVQSQQLLVRADGGGQCVASELLINSPSVENAILKNELERIPEIIENSSNYYKMQSMNQSLERLVKAGTISAEEALKSSTSHADLRLRLSGMVREEGYQMAHGPVSNQHELHSDDPMELDHEEDGPTKA